MKLQFERSNGEMIELAKCQNKEEVWREIKKFLDAHKYKAPYYRVSPNLEEGKVWIDAGSHSEFLWVTDVSEEEMKEWMT